MSPPPPPAAARPPRRSISRASSSGVTSAGGRFKDRVPELPEVETIARDMRPHLTGAAIRSARIFKPDILRNAKRPAFEKTLTGQKIEKVWWRAKHLGLDLESGLRVVIRPGMTGGMYVERGTRNG